MFYYNMEHANLEDSEGTLVEERISTTVRESKIILSASIINTILQISNPPPPPEIDYTNTRIFHILRPNEPVPEGQTVHLSFTPVSMPPLYRVVWYIYSRNLLQKGGNYTHFAQKDYPLFAAIIDKTPINVGEWILKEMIKFRFSSRTVSHVPFASLVSVILYYHRIWHLQSLSEMKKPIVFGKTQLNLMRISFEQPSGHSRASARSFARASQARGEEATSTPAPRSSESLEEKVKRIVQSAIEDLTGKLEAEVGKLVSEVTSGYNALSSELHSRLDELSDAQTDMAATLGTFMVSSARIEEKLDTFMKSQSQSDRPGPSQAFGSSFSSPDRPTDGTTTFSPPPVPPFTFSTPTPITTVHTTPTTQVIPPTNTPSTQILPSPSTDLVVHPSFTPTASIASTVRMDSSSSSAESIPTFEDAKGGEED